MTDAQRKLAALTLAGGALALALAGCSKPVKTETTSSTTTTSVSTTTASATSTPGLPAECQAYIDKVTTCVNKAGATNPMAAQFKTSLDQARGQGATIQDKAALANVCKQSSASFAQTSAAMGC